MLYIPKTTRCHSYEAQDILWSGQGEAPRQKWEKKENYAVRVYQSLYNVCEVVIRENLETSGECILAEVDRKGRETRTQKKERENRADAQWPAAMPVMY